MPSRSALPRALQANSGGENPKSEHQTSDTPLLTRGRLLEICLLCLVGIQAIGYFQSQKEIHALRSELHDSGVQLNAAIEHLQDQIKALNQPAVQDQTLKTPAVPTKPTAQAHQLSRTPRQQTKSTGKKSTKDAPCKDAAGSDCNVRK